jgi:hypothetical protein
VQVLRLRHTRPVFRSIHEGVALDDGDLAELVAERLRRCRPGHARAEDDGVAIRL